MGNRIWDNAKRVLLNTSFSQVTGIFAKNVAKIVWEIEQ